MSQSRIDILNESRKKLAEKRFNLASQLNKFELAIPELTQDLATLQAAINAIDAAISDEAGPSKRSVYLDRGLAGS